MTKKEVLEIMQYISDTDEKCAEDVMYALSLLSTNINKMLESVKDGIHQCTDNNNFKELGRLSDYCTNITTIRDEVESCIDALVSIGTVIPDEPATKPAIPSNYSHEAVDYSLYQIDKAIEHSVDEDFENCKVCAFKLDGKKVNVSSWQDMTVTICAMLAKKDINKMKSFLYDDDFKGRLNNYFMKKSVPRRNKQIPGTDLYVWVNQNANSLVGMVTKAIKKYGYSKKDLVLYLRADYSELHKGN